jgi:hypothetical protein
MGADLLPSGWPPTVKTPNRRNLRGPKRAHRNSLDTKSRGVRKRFGRNTVGDRSWTMNSVDEYSTAGFCPRKSLDQYSGGLLPSVDVVRSCSSPLVSQSTDTAQSAPGSVTKTDRASPDG